MEHTIILQGLTVDQLLDKIDLIVAKRVEKQFKKVLEETFQKKWRYMSRKEVAQLLHITLATLNDWTKLGLLNSYKISHRVLYRSDEIDESLSKRKFSRNYKS